MELYEVKAMLTADVMDFMDGMQLAMGALGEFMSSADKFSGIDSTLKTVGAGMTAGITVPLVGIGALGVKTFAGLDDNLRSTMAVMGQYTDENGNFVGEAADNYDLLKTKAKEWGQESIYSSTEVAGAMAVLASRGLDVNGIMDATPGVINLAAASGMKGAAGIENAANAMGSAMQQFSSQGLESTYVADVFAQAAADTALQGMDLADALRYVGVSASTNGITFEETSAALGVMADSGLRAEQSGRYLNMAFTKMAKPTKAAKEIMDELGISFYDSEGNMKSLSENTAMLREKFADLTNEERQYALATLFGQEAGRGMNVLIEESTGKLETLTNNFENSSGAAGNMARTLNTGISGSMEKMMEAITNAFATIGEILAPTIMEWAKSIEDLMEKFNALDPATQEFIVKAGMILAAIGPLIGIFGLLFSPIMKVGSALAGLIGFLAANPWVLFAAAAVAAVVLIVQNWDSIKEFFSNLWDAIVATAKEYWDGFIEYWTGVADNIKNAWNGITDFFSNLWGMVKDGFVQTWEETKSRTIEIITGFVDGIKEKWEQAKEAVKTTVDNIKEAVTTAWENVKTTTSTVFDSVKSFIKTTWDNIKESIKTALDNIKTAIQDAWNKAKETTQKIVTDIKDKVQESFEKMVAKIKETFTNVVSAVKDGWDGAMREARTFVDKAIQVGKDIIGGFISGVTAKAGELWNAAANAVGGAIEWAKKKLDAHSPSRVFIGLGHDTIDGYIIGIGDKEKETVRAMGSLMNGVISEANNSELDFTSRIGSLNSSVNGSVDHLIRNNENKTPANITLKLGNRSYRAFVEDITNTQGQEAEFIEVYSF